MRRNVLIPGKVIAKECPSVPYRPSQSMYTSYRLHRREFKLDVAREAHEVEMFQTVNGSHTAVKTIGVIILS